MNCERNGIEGRGETFRGEFGADGNVLGGLKAYSRATNHTCSNIISRDMCVYVRIYVYMYYVYILLYVYVCICVGML
jgi:hypothetical protein